MLHTLASAQERKGRQYVQNLLDEEVVVTEKLDTFRITFRREGDKLQFYKKDGTPIGLIERTLNDVWESALLEIPAMLSEVELPENVRFGLYYTPVERPIRIPYTNLPRYILTDVASMKGDRVVETSSPDEVTQWAGVLCMARPPIIFRGRLSEEQKRTLLEHSSRDYESDATFVEAVTQAFGTTYSKQDIIEGIVINAKGKLVQVLSYEFDLLNEAYERSNSSRDFYDLVLLRLNQHLDGYALPQLSSTGEQRYIDLVCNVFESYCEANDPLESLDEKLLTPPQYGHYGHLNPRHIESRKTLELVKRAPIYEALFRVCLSSLRKPKGAYGLFNQQAADRFNGHVHAIASSVNLAPLNEGRSPNVTVNAVRRRQPTDVDNMRIVSALQNAFLPPPRRVKRGEQQVAIYLTGFAPFTAEQRRNVEAIRQQWGVPVVLASVASKGRVLGQKFVPNDEIVAAQMKALSDYDRDAMPAWCLLDSWSLRELFEFCRPGFEPYVVITDPGKSADLAMQLFLEEEVLGGQIGVDPEFNVGEMPNTESVLALRAIEDGNGSLFMELTPGSVHSFYQILVSEHQRWTGAVLRQFEPNRYE